MCSSTGSCFCPVGRACPDCKNIDPGNLHGHICDATSNTKGLLFVLFYLLYLRFLFAIFADLCTKI